MLTLKQQEALDLESVFANIDEQAEEVVYTPTGGASIRVPALINRSEYAEEIIRERLVTKIPVSRDRRLNFVPDRTRSTSTHQAAVVWIQKSDVASPQYGDVITFDSVDWTVTPAYREA